MKTTVKSVPSRKSATFAPRSRVGRKDGSAATPPAEGEVLTKKGLGELMLEQMKEATKGFITEDKLKLTIKDILDERLKGADDAPVTAKQAKSIIAEANSEIVEHAKTEGAEKAARDKAELEKNETPEQKSARLAAEADAMPLTVAGMKGLFGSLAADLVEKLKQPSRKQFATEDDEAVVQAYLPDGERKGNLPVDRKQLLNVLLSAKGGMNDGIRDSDLKLACAKGARELDRLSATRYAGGYKALTVGGVGAGNEWVPSDLSSTLYRRLYLESPLAQYMMAREIVMPTDNYTFPLRTTRPKFYHRGNSVAAIASQPGTGDFTLVAKKLMALVDFEYELEEDSIIPVLPTVLDDLGTAAADAWESALINGDITATHQDSDINAITGAPEKAYVGLRKMALAGNLTTSFATGGVNQANTTTQRKQLGKYGRNPRDLAWLCGIQAYNDMINLPEVFTLDKFGNRATVQTGELFFYKGVQILLCSGIREDLNASGVYDGVTTTKGSFMLAYLPHFITGRRRDFMLEMDKDIKNQTKWLVASFRKAFSAIETPDLATGITPISMGYNYASQ